MTIIINGESINTIIIKKNIKNIYFRFNDDLNLVISTNKWVSASELQRILKEKEEVIYKMYLHKLKELDSNIYFTYLGDNYEIIFDDTAKEISFNDGNVITKDEKMLDKFYLDKCREILTKEVEKNKVLFERLPDFKLRFRKMKTRWGVCNVKDKIVTLNTDLLKKDITLIDYVIIHELCHFYHPNHSASFWGLVSKYYPYYKNARKMLKNV